MRCAIYTRKSSVEGLEQQFNSLDAQRDACSGYVASQKSAGWVALETRYDDGGHSGGTLIRPALKRLLDDIDADLVDVVVVYKIDRLSRSLRDFVQMVERFERNGVTFIAVTQSFNTTTSMGRLTLNVLLSFAQFERELTSERLKDKFAASRARGMWLHGPRPYGYQVVGRMLVIDEHESGVLRRMFARYPKVGSARLLARELNARGLLNHKHRPFRPSFVVNHLRNRLYVGDLVHKGCRLPGVHEPIVTERAWAMAQRALAESARRRSALGRTPVHAILKGLLFDAMGHAMIHSFLTRRGKLYRYYVASHEHRYGAGSDPTTRFRARDLEAAVLALADRINGTPPPPDRSYDEASGLVQRLVRRIDIGPDDMTVSLRTGGTLRADFAGRLG